MEDTTLVAPAQAGVFSGLNPLQFNASDPIVLFIVQVTVILGFCRLIAIPLSYLRQPRIIAEVIAVATLGLVFFLFQVGLEVDIQVIKKDWQKSVAVAVADMALPFGLGGAVSVGLYKIQDDASIPFGSFLLFLGVAMSITAFPVLARILAELKLLRTKVGAITMASGVLLALVVALLNSSGGIVALYVFLTATAFTLFVIFVVGPLYRKLCIHTNSFEDGPSPLLMAVTLMIVLICAFVTNIIGVHSIFGGFLAGVIIPHEHDLSIKITEKIEDMVNIIFLPLYFTLSGLKTQIGLLDSGLVWGYVILVIFLACFGKIVGCAVAAKLSGMTTRESLAVGFLMNCKGLVELIGLNIGHDAGVLNDRVFVILVIMALVTTFMTTPVVMFVYPEWYQEKTIAVTDYVSVTGDPTNDIDRKSIDKISTINTVEPSYCIITMLNRIESVSSVMALIQLLKHKVSTSVDIHTLRLLELTQRTSVVMKYKDIAETERQDPVLNVFRTFANLIGIKSLKTHLDYSSSADYIKTILDYSTRCTVGLFIDRGFGLVRDSDDELSPQVVIVYREGCQDDKAAVLFGLQLQVNKKIKVTILREGPADNSAIYTTDTAIQRYCQDQDINKLFLKSNAGIRNNVTCRTVKTLNGSAVAKSLERPLDERDLVIIGRRGTDESITEENYESALGKIGFEVLKSGTKNSSVLIIQSASSF
ncbi:Sodium/hydrogen exchanger family-domain-containing protein [Thamnidium elegans]|nr:Sodium/hydrogen exchanger family-domain-containing protein [Thamnidium elegans]